VPRSTVAFFVGSRVQPWYTVFNRRVGLLAKRGKEVVRNELRFEFRIEFEVK